MQVSLVTVFLLCTLPTEAPSIVVDNRPESGIPLEATEQMKARQRKSEKSVSRGFREMTQGTIQTVRIRYYNKKIWPTLQQVRAYIAGFLSAKTTGAGNYYFWSESLVEPQIECLVDFTEAYRQKLQSEGKSCHVGRLLIWQTEACYRDGTGRWWFVNAFDYFHKAHPNGDRTLSKGS